jgi:hypothetical protein
MNEWKHGLPDCPGEYLVTDGKSVQVASFIFHNEELFFINETGKMNNIKFWMNKPKPPQL